VISGSAEKTLRTIQADRFITGVTWVDGELWHGTWEGDQSELRQVDPTTGEVLQSLDMPPGMGVSGLESDGGDRLFCGGGSSDKVRAVRRPKRGLFLEYPKTLAGKAQADAFALETGCFKENPSQRAPGATANAPM
jgi:glutamine cyclotransferase